jgi:hypothetical protein
MLSMKVLFSAETEVGVLVAALLTTTGSFSSDEPDEFDESDEESDSIRDIADTPGIL